MSWRRTCLSPADVDACEGTDEFIKQAVFARLADLREQAPDMDEWEEIEVEVIKPVAAIIEMRFEGVELEALFDAAEQCDGARDSVH